MRWSYTLARRTCLTCLAPGQLYLLIFTYADICRDLVSGFTSSGILTKIIHAFCLSPMSDIYLFHSVILIPVILTIFAIQQVCKL